MDNIMSFNIDVGVMINDLITWGEKGAELLIKELHDSHVGRACNDCNGSTIGIYPEQKTSAWPDTYSTDVMKGSHASMMDSYGRYGQVRVGKNSS